MASRAQAYDPAPRAGKTPDFPIAADPGRPYAGRVDRLEQISNGFMQAKVLLAAAELRLFDRLKGKGATVAEIAAGSGWDSRGLEILLDALTAMGIVIKKGDTYRNYPKYEPHLTEDAPDHFVSMLRHRNLMFRKWAVLEDAIRSGPAARPSERPQLAEQAANENYIRAMAAASRRNIGHVADRVPLAGVKVLADFGGGPGLYIEEFSRRAPSAECYLIDLPLTLEVARRILAASAVHDRIRFVAWDFYSDPAPPGLPIFDLIFLSQVIHTESPERNRALFGRLLSLVSPGGRVVVHENVVEPGRISPFAAALFAVNMLAMTPGGRTYTEAEIAGWGRESGFRRERGDRLSERSFLIVLRRAT